MTTRAFRVDGLDCAEEIAILKREVGPVVGGAEGLSFDILNAKMIVSADPGQVTTQSVLDAVARTGMKARSWEEHVKDAGQRSFFDRYGKPVLAGLSGTLLLSGFLTHASLAGSFYQAVGSEGAGVAHTVPLAARVIYLLSILSGVWFVLPKAWISVRNLRPDMNLLMTIAVVGAVVIGEWFEAATVAFLFAVSLLLESWSVGRARRAIESLLESAPPVVRVRAEDGTEQQVEPSDVAVGSTFIVRPGEKIPLDGDIARGNSDVNQAPITGESAPVSKGPGDEVFAGTINGDGTLEAVSTKTADQTTLANIIRMVTEAQSRRAPSEQWVEKFARVYTPVIMVMAMAIFLAPPLLFGGAWEDWFYRALVLLVIACPCALVISTPVSIVSALAASAGHGVLVKGGSYMEAPAGIKAIAFDKTGTLTEGKPRVVELVPWNEHDETELLQRAAALESASNHPLARAILDEAQARGVEFTPAEDFQILPGKGAVGIVRGKKYWLGSHRYLEERGQETPELHERLNSLSDAGHTVVVVGTEDHVCGLVSLADKPRPEARLMIQSLRDAGIQHMVMLTGDNQATASAIAEDLGIDQAKAELLPADKVAAVQSLVDRYDKVAMIGDGVNDAPAMAQASLGIAMGAAGTDAAIETADIALMSDDLSRLPWLIRHAQHTLSIIRQNIGMSLAVKALFVVLTLIGTASLWAAIAADMGTSLLVTFNALRLLKGNVGR
jgi:Zn2+/Cd2+-exporting ATPase